MKVIAFRLLAILMTSILLVIVVVGCGSDVEDDILQHEVLDYVHVPEFVSIDALADGLPNIENLLLVDNILYFTSIDAEHGGSRFYTTRLFSLDIDDGELTELPTYSFSGEKPGNADGGWLQVTGLLSDENENLWILEVGSFFYFDLPSHIDIDNLEDYELSEYRTDFGSFIALRKIDNTGAEILTVDLSQLAERQAGRQGLIGIITFSVDYDNNIYVGFEDAIYILDSSGNVLFDVEVDGWVRRLVRMSDGSVAHFGWHDREGMLLQVIDTQNRAWGENIVITSAAQDVFAGNEDFLVFINDGANILGIDAQTGYAVQILDLMANGIISLNVRNATVLPDERILLTIQSREQAEDAQTTELIFFSLMPSDVLAERTVLMLASWLPSPSIQSAVAEFNATSFSHTIEILDYGENDLGQFVDFDTAMDRLVLDITAGIIPDIFDLSVVLSSRKTEWANSGLFVDLYAFIDEDLALSRSDFIDGALRAVEIDGKLYRIPFSFSINTLIGDADILGGSGNWTIEAFKSVISDNPQAEYPLGRLNSSREGFLYTALHLSFIDFVDWESGVTYFDSDNFIELLEFAYNTFSENFVIDFAGDFDFDEFLALVYQEPMDIMSGKQIISNVKFNDLTIHSWYREVFGGEFAIVGFPSTGGGGSLISNEMSFAIASASNDAQAAWDFIRTFLTPEGQWRNVGVGFPTNRVRFEDELVRAMGETVATVGMMDLTFEVTPLTPEDVELIMGLVESIEFGFTVGRYDGLWNIVRESAFDYWNGQISVQDAVRIIQNRASIYVSERQR